jgi:hypothetical protein
VANKDERWQEFERIVTRIQEGLDPGSEVTTGHLLDRMTGEQRQIDVIVRGKVGGRAITVMIECRDHKKPVDVKYLDEVVTKRNDVRADKAVIVSAAGFTEAAKKKAEAYGIDLLTLRDVPVESCLYWLGVPALTSQEYRADIPSVYFDTGNPETKTEDLYWDAYTNDEGKLNCSAPVLTDDHGETWSLFRLLNRVLKFDQALVDDVPSTGERVMKTIKLTLGPPMRAALRAGGYVDVREVDMDVDFYRVEVVQPFRGKLYADASGNTVAEFAEATILTNDERDERIVPVRISVVRDASGRIAVVADTEGQIERVTWVEEEGEK